MSEMSVAPSRAARHAKIGGASLGSSTVAIGTATVFIAIAAGLSLLADDGRAASPAAWTLRGSIAAEQLSPPTGDRRQVARSYVD